MVIRGQKRKNTPYKGIFLARPEGLEPPAYWFEVMPVSLYPVYCVYYVYTVTILGVKESIMSIISIVSTQVAPRLHHWAMRGRRLVRSQRSLCTGSKVFGHKGQYCNGDFLPCWSNYTPAICMYCWRRKSRVCSLSLSRLLMISFSLPK